MIAIISKVWMMSLQASVLIAVVLVIRFFLKKYPKGYSYFLWAIVGLRLLCPIWVEIPETMTINLPNVSASLEQMTEVAEIEDVQIEKNIENDSYNIEEKDLTTQKESVVNEHSNQDAVKYGDSKVVLQKIAIGIYCLGVFVCMLVYSIQYLLMKKRLVTAVLAKKNVWFCETIDTPFVMGIFKPQIYLPYGLDKTSGRYILKHERTHIKHRDPLIRLIGVICLCLHWWNPLVWLAVHKMNEDMEMYCDEGFLSQASLMERKIYAKVLLSFAAHKSGLWCELAFGESHTEKRVKNIIYRKKKSTVCLIIVFLVTLLCGCSFLQETTTTDEEDKMQGFVETQDEENSSQEETKGQEETKEQENVFDVYAELEKTEEQAAELESAIYEDDSLTQQEMNSLAEELYLLWDAQLNTIWAKLKETLTEEEMNQLTIEERVWIENKEQEVQNIASQYAGGSIVDLLVYQKKAELTRNRVYELAAYFDGYTQ